MSAPVRSGLIWWDDHQRLWTLQWMDAEGNEIRETEYDARKGRLVAGARVARPGIPLSIGTKNISPNPYTFED